LRATPLSKGHRRPYTLEVFEERLGPRGGIVFLYPRQQRAMTRAALSQIHF
jgi:hypothetical protein